MSATKTTYVVSALETKADGKRMWKTLLATSNVEEANSLVEAMRQDGVDAKYEVFLPRKKV